jgi:chemotaxis methyl-accepting protein methylase
LLLADYGLDPTRGGMLGTLEAHVEARIAQLGLGDSLLAEAKFVERVRTDIAERERLIHAITVRHSWFYRDPGQLDGLLERMQARYAESRDHPLDVWIAGCATGDEAWTIAMLAADVGVELRLRATDLDAVALKLAQLGEYGAWTLRELPERLRRFIEPSGPSRWRVTDELRGLDIAFQQHNLCDPPLSGPFDVICCRNVLIYFQPARAKAVVDCLRGCLRSEGELLLGAGDMLFQIGGRVGVGSATARAVAKPEPARRAAKPLDASAATATPPSAWRSTTPVGVPSPKRRFSGMAGLA